MKLLYSIRDENICWSFTFGCRRFVVVHTDSENMRDWKNMKTVRKIMGMRQRERNVLLMMKTVKMSHNNYIKYLYFAAYGICLRSIF